MRLKRWLPALTAVCLLAAPAAGWTQSAPAAGSGAPTVADRAADIEERLIDLQIRIATLRSLAAHAAPVATADGAAASSPPRTLADAGQIAALEGEVATLSVEAQKLSGRPSLILSRATVARQPAPDSRALAASPVPSSPVSGLSTPPAGLPPTANVPATGWAGSTTVQPNTGLFAGQPQGRPAVPPAAPAAPGLFGAPQPPVGGQATLSGELLPGNVYPGYDNTAPPGTAPAAPSSGRVAVPGVPGAANPPAQVARIPAGDDAEAEYQTAYGYLLQQDYGAAQAAFSAFLKRYPRAALAGNAQYWLGETHYVRGAYKKAAVAFLKGYENYGNGNKGADSLLKLAMSLGKLRQTAAACSSLRELGTRYRSAPQAIKTRAAAEKRRLRCPG